MLVGAAAVSLAACQDVPTAPLSPAGDSPVAAVSGPSFSVAGAAGASLDFDSDLSFVEQIAAEFSDSAASERFLAHLTELRANLGSGDKAAARDQLALVEGELASAGCAEGDRGYIELVFRNIGAAVAESAVS